MRTPFGYAVTLASIGFSMSALSSEPNQKIYVKGASQFCFPNLDAHQQIEYYKRIINIGASYSHGCMGCDQNAKMRGYTELTNDQLWFRRNYLLHFLTQAEWKKEGFVKGDKIAIMENDPKNRPAALIPEWSLKQDGYRGEWIYDPKRDAAHLTAPDHSDWLQQNTHYGNNALLVGGIENSTSLKTPRHSSRYGTVYQTFTEKGAQNPQAPVVFDLAVDGGRMQDFFGSYLRPELYRALDQSKWTDKQLREQAIRETVAYIKNMNPSIIIGIDTFFWDSVSHALAYMRESRPSSLVVRLVLDFMARRDRNGNNFNEVRRFNISQDFFRVVEAISVENEFGPSVPILLAKLHDNPLQVFAQNNYEPVLAAIFGQYFETLVGVNFAEHLAFWLRKIAYSQNAHMQLTPVEPGWTPQTKERSLSTQRKARMAGYFDEENETYFSANEVASIRESYEEYEKQLQIVLQQRGILNEDLSESQMLAKLQSSTGIVARLANWLVLKAIKDLPLFMESLEKAMQHENRTLRAVTSKSTNNVHIVNVDKFYEHFPYFLKPETMHPSVFGAKQMALMVNKAICSSGAGQ